MQVNIKRLLSFLVVLAMVLSMTPVTGIPAIEAKADDTVTETTVSTDTSYTENLVFQEGTQTAWCPVCKDNVEWNALSSGKIGNTTAEKTHYYLAADATVSSPFINFAGKHTVCLHLNGKNLSINGTNSEAIIVQSQGTLNVMGEGTIKRITNGILFKVWTCTLNLYGGTYITNPNNYGLSDATNCMVMQTNSTNAKVTLYNNASLLGTVEHKLGLLTLAEGWNGQIGNLQVADTLWSGNAIKKANVTVNGDLTGTVVCDQSKMVLADGLLTKGETKLTANEYCQTCGKYVSWTALKNGQRPDGTSDHYYLAEDISSTDKNFIAGTDYKQGSASPSVCLRLNGKKLTTNCTDTTNGAIYGSNATTINIYGEGGTVINTGVGPLIATDTARVNLYGGTYISAAKNAATIRGKDSYLYLYNDAKIEGAAAVSNGKVYLNDSASIKGLKHTGGEVTAAEGWTGFLKNAEGKYLELQDGVWTAVTKTAEWGKFEPEACDGYAYCEACGKDAGPMLWTAKKGSNRIEYVDTDGEANHYYLTGDLTEPVGTGQVAGVTSGFTMCVNLNGYNITAPGQVYVAGTMSFFGDGNFTFTGDTTATHSSQGDIYRNAGFYFATSAGVLNLLGGTYSVSGVAEEEGKPTIQATGKVTLKNATVNGYIAANKGSNIRLEETAVAEDIRIADTGKVVVAAGWSGTANLTAPEGIFDGVAIAAANGVAEDDFTGTLTCNGVELSKRGGTLKADITFVPGAETNYCEHCGKFVAWTALRNGETITNASNHYYVAEDMTAKASSRLIYGSDFKDIGSVCLHLNGKTLTTGSYNNAAIYCSNSVDISIMGDGTVINGGTGLLFEVHTSDVFLYGGTYGDNTSKGIMEMKGGSAKVYLHNDAKIDGLVTASAGNLYLNDSASVTNLAISGGKTTFKSDWDGTAVVSAVAELIDENNTINVANAYVEDNATGIITSVAGFEAEVVDHAIKLNDPMPGEFDPQKYGGYAYCNCVICGKQKLVQWTDFNKFVADNGNELYVDGATPTYHFYLSSDLTYTDHVLSTYENIILNLNGHNITPVAKEGETAITASYAFSCTQKLILMNTSPEMSTVTGWSTKAGDSTVLWMNGGTSGGTYLMGNVTLTTHKDCTTDAPVARIAGNGAKFYMEGGIIDASKKVNTNYPCAVYLEGKDTVNAVFYMNSGVIKGGTSVDSAGAVQIGSNNTTTASYLDGACFYMTGGTISGGKANNGGNLFINKNAKEVEITGGTITGGEATLSGGNIYSKGADLTIGEGAVISLGSIPFTNVGTAGTGGGNIWFGDGTLTINGGEITGGKVEKFKGAGGNIFLDNGANGEVHFIMNGGEISGGVIPFGNEPIYEGADPAGQNYGANIRAYNIQEMKLLGGTIEGGIGGNPEKAKGRDVYLSCNNIETVLTIGNVTINGAIHLAKHKLILQDAPKIKATDGKNALTVGDGADVLADISGLTEGADVQFSGVTPNVPFTVVCNDAEALKEYITVIDSKAPLTVQGGQLILIGVAIVGGEEIEWYDNNAAAVAAYTADSYAAGKYIQLGLDTALELLGGEYLIDLAGNGDAAEVAITGTGTAHLIDSANTDYKGFRTATVDETITLECDNTAIVDGEAIRFITVTVGGKTSAHALDMAITGVNLRTDKAGLYYVADYNCDETLAELVSQYGVILSLKDMPGAEMDSTDKRTVRTDFAPGAHATSSSVTGIFKDTRTADKNAEYGMMKIYANAYIELDLDGNGEADVLLVADTEHVGEQAGNAWSLYDVLLDIDQNWNTYTAKEQYAIREGFYDLWYAYGMSAYADDFSNIDVKVVTDGGEAPAVVEQPGDASVPVGPADEA